MKHISIVVCVMLYFSCFMKSFGQASSEVIFIGQSSLGGVRNYNRLIATNNTSLFDVQKKLKLERDFGTASIVKKESFECLENFISKNCITKDTETGTTGDLILIRIFTKSGVQTCYLVDKRQISAYFNDLKLRINMVTNRTDKKILIEMIDSVLRVVNNDILKLKHS